MLLNILKFTGRSTSTELSGLNVHRAVFERPCSKSKCSALECSTWSSSSLSLFHMVPSHFPLLTKLQAFWLSFVSLEQIKPECANPWSLSLSFLLPNLFMADSFSTFRSLLQCHLLRESSVIISSKVTALYQSHLHASPSHQLFISVSAPCSFSPCAPFRKKNIGPRRTED